MSEASPVYLGIDLGTSNSVAALFDNHSMEFVRNAQGAFLTPSVVRIDGRGTVTVGARARRFLESDPENTHAAFKRLMGSASPLRFPASARTMTAGELAACVLESICHDVREQCGFFPRGGVISIPALFELPQSAATSEAARKAGLETVELIAEPVASALAAGWTAQESNGYWLVYDLGGGTFDASLLETRDGFLRVVGHDGDNFLGGRDFDAALVDWALSEFKTTSGLTVSRGNPQDEPLVRKVRQAVEETRIELSRTTRAALTVPLLKEGRDLDLVVDRELLQRLTSPFVQRTLDVTRRLIERHRVRRLERIVLVGGPTLTPYLRIRVVEALEAPCGEGLDPMTLVAQGAAIFAASTGLDARPRSQITRPGRNLWLHYPPVSTDLFPHLVGRLAGEQQDPPLHAVRARRADGQWRSEDAVLDSENGFVMSLELTPRKPCEFNLEGRTRDGNHLELNPSSITIVQGLTIGDPPLSRAVGVALADNRVRIYFERGTPLPARRTFVHHTVESLVGGAGESVLKIPIVQGEFERADLCRLVGTLLIAGDAEGGNLPPSTRLEVTLEVDRSGRLSARAIVPATGRLFEHVAFLCVPDTSHETLAAALDALAARLRKCHGARSGKDLVEAMEVELALVNVTRDVEAARGGDADAGLKAQRLLQEIDARVDAIETRTHWMQLHIDAQNDLTWAGEWVSSHGTPAEQDLFEEVALAVRKARQEEDLDELQRRLVQVRRMGTTAWFRHPDAWRHAFEAAASHINAADDLPRAQVLVRDGWRALQAADRATLQSVTEELWKLMPHDPELRRKGHDSGVR